MTWNWKETTVRIEQYWTRQILNVETILEKALKDFKLKTWN